MILAKVIRKFGDAPWPLMERFQRELKAIEDREALLVDLLGEAPPSPYWGRVFLWPINVHRNP